MNADCAIKSLALLASCLSIARTSAAWGSIASECAEIWKHARLAIECAASADLEEKPTWFLDFRSASPDCSERSARITIVAKRGMAAVKDLESLGEREPSAVPIVLAASLLFRAVSTHPESLGMPRETAKLLADVNELFEPDSKPHETPNLL